MSDDRIHLPGSIRRARRTCIVFALLYGLGGLGYLMAMIGASRAGDGRLAAYGASAAALLLGTAGLLPAAFALCGRAKQWA